MIGGTSREPEEAVVLAVAERGCDMVVDVEAGAVTEEEGVISDWLDEEVEGVSCSLPSGTDELLLLASGFRETPRSFWISLGVKPLDSRNEILRSVEEPRIDSSSRNLDAWSRRSCRVVDAGASGASSELGEGGD